MNQGRDRNRAGYSAHLIQPCHDSAMLIIKHIIKACSEASMYKTASRFAYQPSKFGPRAAFVPPDEYNLVEAKTPAELRAAGVRDATLEFVETVKQHLRNFRKEDDFTCGRLATLLNGRGILTATGGRWTGRIVKIFADRYMPDPMHF